MLKLIFKTISLAFFTVVALLFLALWRGGQDFKWAGQKTQEFGAEVEKFAVTAEKARAFRKQFITLKEEQPRPQVERIIIDKKDKNAQPNKEQESTAPNNE
jgi:hypothetical protein